MIRHARIGRQLSDLCGQHGLSVLSATDGAEWLRYLSKEYFFASVSLFVTLAEKPAS